MLHQSRCVYSVPATQASITLAQRHRPIYVVRGRPGPLDRSPLPPGHPDSWGLITDDTILHGSAYVIPASPRGRAC